MSATRIITRYLLAAVAAVGLTAGIIAGEAPKPAPAPVPAADGFALPDGSIVLVVIPNLGQLLDHAEAVATTFKPGIAPGSVKAAVGAMLGDPALTKLAAKPVVLLVGGAGFNVSAAIAVPSKDTASYLANALEHGMQGKVVDDLVILGKDEASLGLADKLVQAVAAAAKDPVQADLRLTLPLSQITKTYGPMVAMFSPMMIAQMDAKPETKPMAKMMPLIIGGILAGADDVRALRYELTLSAKSIDGSITVVGQGALAKALVAPTVTGEAAAKRFDDQPGMLVAMGGINMAALAVYAQDLVERLKAKPDCKDLIDAKWSDLIAGLNNNTGEVAMRVRTDKDKPLIGETVVGVKDPVKALDQMEKEMSWVIDGPLGSMLKANGVTGVSLKRNGRSVGEVKIHQIIFAFDPTNTSPEAQALRKAMVEQEVAVVAGQALSSKDPAALDALIAGKGPGLKVAAVTAFGADQHGYMDLDLIGLIKAQAKTDPNLALFAGALENAKSGEPIALAWTIQDGQAVLKGCIPLAPIAEAAKPAMGLFGGGEDPKPAAQPVF